MENSDSNSSKKQAFEKQALRMQAKQLLPKITNFLQVHSYNEIVHKRLSQQQHSAEIIYQGLTRATHSTFGEVVVKWAMSPICVLNLIGLTREIEALKVIATLQQQKKLTAITPRILAYDTFSIEVLDKKQQLTYLVNPWYLRGSLATYLQDTLSDKQKLQCIIKVAQLIVNLHDSGWLHNDIKPSNIVLNLYNRDKEDDSFELLLIDFALAQQIKNISQKSIDEEIFNAGTPAYLAPERWQNQNPTIQSEVYAFGVMMYEVLVGVRPFNIKLQSNDLVMAWATQHCQQAIPRLPLASELYQKIIDKALAKKVENRYANVREILEDLQSIAIKSY